jgi:hypothetical protein
MLSGRGEAATANDDMTQGCAQKALIDSTWVTIIRL